MVQATLRVVVEGDRGFLDSAKQPHDARDSSVRIAIVDGHQASLFDGRQEIAEPTPGKPANRLQKLKPKERAIRSPAGSPG
jgi:hypothetical protein